MRGFRGTIVTPGEQQGSLHVLEDHVVLIEAGTIVEVAPADDIDLPSHAIQQLSSTQLLPGFVDW
jgi:imidazolonepropionase-like amidohydrolase